MASIEQEFKNISIIDKGDPVLFGRGDLYVMALLLSNVPPRRWLDFFKHEFGGSYPDEHIMDAEEVSTPTALIRRGWDVGQCLYFQFTQEPHPKTEENLKKSCETANKKYRRYLEDQAAADARKREAAKAEEDEQARKNQKAAEVTKGWFSSDKG